jgi:hypothetical protein
VGFERGWGEAPHLFKANTENLRVFFEKPPNKTAVYLAFEANLILI